MLVSLFADWYINDTPPIQWTKEMKNIKLISVLFSAFLLLSANTSYAVELSKSKLAEVKKDAKDKACKGKKSGCKSKKKSNALDKLEGVEDAKESYDEVKDLTKNDKKSKKRKAKDKKKADKKKAKDKLKKVW